MNDEPERVGGNMRIDHYGLEIELHPGSRECLWVVFDENGEQLRTGSAPDKRKALAQARRSAWALLLPVATWLHLLTHAGVRPA